MFFFLSKWQARTSSCSLREAPKLIGKMHGLRSYTGPGLRSTSITYVLCDGQLDLSVLPFPYVLNGGDNYSLKGCWED